MRIFFLIISYFIFTGAPAFAEETALPRILVGLYDSRESEPRDSTTHRFLEMPANHLGYDIHYYDINKPLPKLTDDMHGAVIWLSAGNEVPDAESYLKWLEQLVESGKQLVIIENAGIAGKLRQRDSILQQYNRILSYIGIQDLNQWNSITYKTDPIYVDPAIGGFERPIGPILPAFGHTQIIPGKSKSHVKVAIKAKEEEAIVDLVATSKNGGFIAEGYAIFHIIENNESRIVQWFVNPFEFLRRALNMPLMPIPDITTLNGRRIFYSHIDGDGWNNLCEISRYRRKQTLSAEVIQKEIIMQHPDFAFTVGLVTADVLPECYGLKDSEQIARNIFALPNVEPSSHTHSHPLYWHYFSHYTPEREEPLLDRYPVKPLSKTSIIEDIKDKTNTDDWKSLTKSSPYYKVVSSAYYDASEKNSIEKETEMFEKGEHKQYETPRSYACTPFLLDEEISGSIKRINALSPAHKKARLIQWSGNTSPYEEAIENTRKSGFLNINGGDSRFDNEYPSYSSVAPIGLQVGKERQIYSSNSNENTYTNLWTGRFFGFRYLKTTIQNTESPIRIRPFNIYFHMYSGQKQASLNAVKENLNFARSQSVIPIKTSKYAMIANDYYATRIIPIGDKQWKIKRNGELGTIRFDYASDLMVDFNQSKGILGQHYLHKSLYVTLAPSAEDHVIKLKNKDNNNTIPQANRPYLIDSRWLIKDLQLSKSLLTFQTHGYGHGEMSWMMPKSGNYLIQATKDNDLTSPVFAKEVTTDKNGLLNYVIDVMAPEDNLKVTIKKMEP